MKPIIRVENLSKQYRIGAKQASYATLRESLTHVVSAPFRRLSKLNNLTSHQPPATSHPFDTIWALKDVSFEVPPGEVVGIIGRNGAGKSTLLKILSRITEPTTGRVDLYGRVGSLLEVGTGFHPELTGRENIYLNGAILGMKEHEIRRKFDDIVDFAEIGGFIDTPVKRYSSGMHIRLAFAVAAHLETEILIVDEVLAVGDIEFQRKCLGKMGEISNNGRTVLLVSHNIPIIQSLASRCLHIKNGQLALDSLPSLATIQYLNEYEALSTSPVVDLFSHKNRGVGKKRILKQIWITDKFDKVVNSVSMGEAICIHIEYSTNEKVLQPIIGLGVESLQGDKLFGLNSLAVPSITSSNTLNQGIQVYKIPKLPLREGEYFITLSFSSSKHERNVDVIERAYKFKVMAADIYGTGHLPHKTVGAFWVDGVWEYKETA